MSKATSAIKTNIQSIQAGLTLGIAKRSISELASAYGRNQYGITALAQQYLQAATTKRSKKDVLANLNIAFRIMEAEEKGVIAV
jgi:hypothetical protein